jgi:hypothetical protein
MVGAGPCIGFWWEFSTAHTCAWLHKNITAIIFPFYLFNFLTWINRLSIPWSGVQILPSNPAVSKSFIRISVACSDKSLATSCVKWNINYQNHGLSSAIDENSHFQVSFWLIIIETESHWSFYLFFYSSYYFQFRLLYGDSLNCKVILVIGCHK